MALYRKIALTEATQWFKMGDHPAVVAAEVGGVQEIPHIKTLGGPMTVSPGDWIAGPGAAGEFWAIKPDVFAATYEPVDEAQAAAA